MKKFFSKLKEKLGASSEILDEVQEEGYVELDTSSPEAKAKITVRPFVIDDFESIKPILDVLRDGTTIALVNIKPLKEKDLVELKRAVNKLKKTCDAIEGEIAGFGEDYIIVTPSFAQIYRSKGTQDIKAEPVNEELKGTVTEVEEDRF